MSRKSDERRLEEVRDQRRWAVDRPSEGPRGQNDWAKAREQGEAARVATAMELRQKLGLSTTDAEIRKLAAERTEAATRRAMRDAGEG